MKINITGVKMIKYTKPKVIAEIGCNHKGELEIAKELMFLAKQSGADIAKFQKRNNKELLSCIDRASLLIREADKTPIVLNIGDDNLELKINSNMGSMKEDIDIRKEGKDILIGFNPKFIMDALRVIDDENVDIYLFNPKAPCFIKDKEESYIYLILPINFNAVE
jgi:hypothetical protein